MRADSVTGQTPPGALRPGGGMEPDVATARVPGPIVGAQWELRRAMARTDQRFGHSDIFVRAHVDRRLPRGDRPSGCFSSQHRQHPFRAAREGRARTKLLIPRRLARDGSPVAFRSPAPGSPGLPRSETSARGHLLGKGRLLEPKSPSGQNSRLRTGIKNASAAPRRRQNGSGFTRHRPPAIPIAPLQQNTTGVRAVPCQVVSAAWRPRPRQAYVPHLRPAAQPLPAPTCSASAAPRHAGRPVSGVVPPTCQRRVGSGGRSVVHIVVSGAGPPRTRELPA